MWSHINPDMGRCTRTGTPSTASRAGPHHCSERHVRSLALFTEDDGGTQSLKVTLIVMVEAVEAVEAEDAVRRRGGTQPRTGKRRSAKTPTVISSRNLVP